MEIQNDHADCKIPKNLGGKIPPYKKGKGKENYNETKRDRMTEPPKSWGEKGRTGKNP